MRVEVALKGNVYQLVNHDNNCTLNDCIYPCLKIQQTIVGVSLIMSEPKVAGWLCTPCLEVVSTYVLLNLSAKVYFNGGKAHVKMHMVLPRKVYYGFQVSRVCVPSL